MLFFENDVKFAAQWRGAMNEKRRMLNMFAVTWRMARTAHSPLPDAAQAGQRPIQNVLKAVILRDKDFLISAFPIDAHWWPPFARQGSEVPNGSSITEYLSPRHCRSSAVDLRQAAVGCGDYFELHPAHATSENRTTLNRAFGSHFNNLQS
jgi:hypothetical protein